MTNRDYLMGLSDRELAELELVDSLEETERGADGFGSTGR